MPSAFEIASAITEQADPRRFRCHVPDGWQQGRGAFGGLVLATLLRAIQRCEPDAARTVRTLIGDLCGPVVTGDADIEVAVMRRGANQSNIRAELRQNGEVLAHAAAVLSTARAPGLTSPPRPRAESLPPLERTIEMPPGAPGAPVFTKHFQYKIASGLPFSGGAAPETSGYIRERESPAAIDAPMMMALLDAYWPAFFAAASAPRPIATVSFTAEIVTDLTKLDPRAPLFYRARTITEFEGFQPELRELFDAEGNLVALNHQTFCVIK